MLKLLPSLFLVLFLAGAPAQPAAAAQRSKAAFLIVSPSGGVMRPGESAQISAIALDKRGDRLPDAAFKFSSSRSGVVSVDSTGRLTASAQGSARITVKTKGKKYSFVLQVAQTLPDFLATGLGQINHLIVDDEWVYWTEFTFREAAVRKVRRAGGLICDLARELGTDRRGVSVTYAQLDQTAGSVFWSRETAGFFDHWSIRSVAKPNGVPAELLAEDISVEPMLNNAWAATAGHLAVVVERPAELGLPDATRIAARNLSTGAWTALVTGNFDRTRTQILASDERYLYVRAVDSGDQSHILKVDVEGAPDSYQTLFQAPGVETVQRTAGAVNSTSLFYWSKDGPSRLMRIPLAGGTPQMVQNADGAGLAADETHVYWVLTDGKVFRAPVGGGAAELVTSGVARVSSTGGLALSGGVLFLATTDRDGSYRILPLTP